jgi:predicted transglutaminase-like cysteine proteinase
MRTAILALMSIAGAAALSASPASAERSYPYCLQTFGPTAHVECAYYTMEQCKASASGRAAECFRDPFFPIYEEPRPQRRRHYR